MTQQQPEVLRSDHGTTLVLGPVGEFDLACVGLLHAALVEALADGPRVVLDLSRMTFADSTVLSAVVGAGKRASEAGGWVRVAGPTPTVRRLFEITALDSVFELYDSVADAVGDGDREPAPADA